MRQLEGIERIREMGATTNHWDWVDCGVGKLYLAGNDDGIAMRFLHGHVYEPVSVKLWQQLCDGAKLVLDVGAHTGFYTLAAFHAGAESVLSVEPYYINAARLQMNMRANGHDIVNCVLAAASDKEGIGYLYVPSGALNGGYCTGASRLNKYESGIAYPTRIVPLDILVGDRFRSSVKAIKLDVEYHLLRALRGACKLLEEGPDLIFECFETGVDEFLRPYGYRFWAIDEQAGLTYVESLDQRDPAGSRNYLASVRPSV